MQLEYYSHVVDNRSTTDLVESIELLGHRAIDQHNHPKVIIRVSNLLGSEMSST